MSSGLPVPYSSVFGDPEVLPIMSARSGQVLQVTDADPDGDRWEFVMPAGTLAFELSILNGADEAVRARYLAGPELTQTTGGIVRLVPGNGQVIEYRHAVEGDVLLVEVIEDDDVEVIVHAHLGATE